MNFPRFRAISLSFASFLATAVVAVAQLLPEKEEDIPVEFIPRLENTVSIGYYRLSSGPRVRFNNLGMIRNNATQAASLVGTGSVTRTYANGSVAQDSPNTYEKKLDGTALTEGFSQFANAGWISKVTADGVITVYTPVSIAQTDANGNLIQNPNGSFLPVTSPAGTVLADGSTTTSDTPAQYWAATQRFLAYKDGRTRSWSVANQSQINEANGTVSMSTYGATSAGVSVEADSTASSGFELTLERRMGQRGHFEWGVAGGIKLVGINAKAHAVIPAYLTSTTDVYKMVPIGYQADGVTPKYHTGVGLTPSVNVANLALYAYDPSTTSHVDAILTNQFKDQIAALRFLNSSSMPLDHTVGGDMTGITTLDVTNIAFGTTQLDAQGRVAAVQGNWQLKGAYYMIRVGPTFRYRFNDTFSVSGSFGMVQGYVGTTFKAEEAFDDTLDVYTDATFRTLAPIPDKTTPAQVYRSKEENVTHKFVPGVYGEVNVEYWVTERTGFYFGMTKQAMRNFTQSPLSGRTATIDMGSSSGWKLGVMTRF